MFDYVPNSELYWNGGLYLDLDPMIQFQDFEFV